MDKRRNFTATLKRGQCDHVPFCLSLCPALRKEFEARTGKTNVEEYFDFDFRGVGLNETVNRQDYSRYYGKLKDGTFIDEWGVGFEPCSTQHFTRFLHPMESFDDPSQVEAFPMPDYTAPYRYEGVKERVDKIHKAGYAAHFGAIQIFEFAWYLRGLDNLLCDMLTDADMAKACLSRVADTEVTIARKMAEAGVDSIMFGDDVGTQRGMMMDKSLWRKWLKGDMARAIAAAKEVNPDILCVYHSDGVIYDIIPELIEIGVDVLNPVQPECVDPALLKKQYGDRLSFWGTIGTQTTMPFGTTKDVKNAVKTMIETVGEGGGLLIAPTHLLEPDVPFDNILAMVDAVQEYGQY